MPSGFGDGKEENVVVDEWTTVEKPSRRCRPQRRRNRDRKIVGAYAGSHNKTRDASEFFEKAVAAQLHATVDAGDSVTEEQIESALGICLRELRESKYWETVRQVLRSRIERQDRQFRSIVCYGIGNFGTKRPSAPLWQLALAVLIREYVSTTAIDGARDNESKTLASRSVTMHYFEPLMTIQESNVLQTLGVRIIEENERGKRSVNDDGDSSDNNYMTLFFMPHCPMSLYTNLFHTNWDYLREVIIFGNSLNNYIDGGNANIVVDPQKQQALGILEVLQPFWDVDRLQINKRDVSDTSAYFEQAFNDSSFTSFATTYKSSAATETDGWPKRPQLDSPNDYDGGGEVL